MLKADGFRDQRGNVFAFAAIPPLQESIADAPRSSATKGRPLCHRSCGNETTTARILPSQEYLRECFDYDPDTVICDGEVLKPPII